MREFSDETCCTDSECPQWPNVHTCDVCWRKPSVRSVIDDDVVTFFCADCFKVHHPSWNSMDDDQRHETVKGIVQRNTKKV